MTATTTTLPLRGPARAEALLAAALKMDTEAMSEEEVIAAFLLAVPDADVGEISDALHAAAAEHLYEAAQLERRRTNA